MIPLGLYRTTKVNLLAYNEQLNGDRPLKKPSDMGNNENQMNPNQFNQKHFKDSNAGQNKEFASSSNNNKFMIGGLEIFKTIKYVVTNPDKETRLEKEDLVFVLAKTDPGDPDKWDEYD